MTHFTNEILSRTTLHEAKKLRKLRKHTRRRTNIYSTKQKKGTGRRYSMTNLVSCKIQLVTHYFHASLILSPFPDLGILYPRVSRDFWVLSVDGNAFNDKRNSRQAYMFYYLLLLTMDLMAL